MNSSNASSKNKTVIGQPMNSGPASARTVFACALLASALTVCVYESGLPVAGPMTDDTTIVGESIPDYCRVIKRRSYGDIGPYRRNMYWRIARKWKVDPTENSAIVISVNLAQNGTLLKQQLLHGSGSAEEDQQAMQAIANAEFAPLPAWFKRKKLQLKIPMCKIQQLIRVPTECYLQRGAHTVEKNRA